MHIQGVKREEEQLERKCEDLSSYNEDIIQIRSEIKVVGHRSYTADLYDVELLMEK